MSFRTRPISFFALIVVVPMVAVGFLVFRLIGDSQQGKADARVNGLATAAASVYQSASLAARSDAQTVARDATSLSTAELRNRLASLLSQAGLAGVTVTEGSNTVADLGDHRNRPRRRDRRALRSPSALRHRVAADRVAVWPRADRARGWRRRGSGRTDPQRDAAGGRQDRAAPAGDGHDRGRFVSGRDSPVRRVRSFEGSGDGPLGSVDDLRVARSKSAPRRALHRWVRVARPVLLDPRLAGASGPDRALPRGGPSPRQCDFSSPVPTDGRDEFAALGQEFNSMSSRLARRLEELGEERARLRGSIRRIGETFASNLDRPALLELALRTSMDAVQAESGRLSARTSADEPLAGALRVGALTGLEERVDESERRR